MQNESFKFETNRAADERGIGTMKQTVEKTANWGEEIRWKIADNPCPDVKSKGYY
jgi:hypothetical protein